MNNDERLCCIALTLCPGIGHIGAKRLMDGIGSAVDVFGRRKELPELLPGVNVLPLFFAPSAKWNLWKRTA